MADDILTRRQKLGLTTRPSIQLTSIQTQIDQMDQAVVKEATNPYTLAAVMTGGAVFQKIQSLGYARVLPLAADSKTAFPLVKTAIHTLAVTGEAGAFVTTDRSLKVAFEGADPALLKWQGENGIAQAWKNSLINFASLRASGSLLANQSSLLRHAGASATMVVSNQFSAALGLIPSPQGNMTQQFTEALILDAQMTASMGMLHGILPSTGIPHPDEIYTQSLARFYADSARSKISVESSPELAIAYTEGELGVFERMFRDVANNQIEKAGSGQSSLGCLGFFSLFMGSKAKLALAKKLVELMDAPRLSEKDLRKSSELFPDLLKALPETGSNELFTQIKQALHDTRDPGSNFRNLLLLNHLLPYLNGNSYTEAIHLAIAAIANPHPSVGQIGEHILSALNLERLSRTELIEAGNYLRGLDFQPALAGNRVRNLITSIAATLAIKKSGNEREQLVQSIETAQWLGQFLEHPDYRLAARASLNWLVTIRDLPIQDMVTLFHNFQESMGDSLSSHLYWAQFSQEQLAKHSDPQDPLHLWHQRREEAALKQIRLDLLSLEIPGSWHDISGRISNIRSSSEAFEVQRLIQDKMRSPDQAQQRVVDRWFSQMEPAKRWMALELLTGPDHYLPMNAGEALRWRKLASLGLPNETAIASSHAKPQNSDPVYLVLGSHSSVGVPEALIEKIGVEEAAKYLMIHHTHPQDDAPGYLIHTGQDINEIYPSTSLEGGSGGDLHILWSRFESIPEGQDLALSVTHALGGSIFVLRKINGKPVLDIYSGSTNPIFTSTFKDNPLLGRVRSRIKNWSQRQEVIIETHFYQVPYESVEAFHYPSNAQRGQAQVDIQEIQSP